MKSSGRSGTRSSSAGLNYMFITTRRALTFSGSGGSEARVGALILDMPCLLLL